MNIIQGAIAAIGDLFGLIGALLLALPFVRTQQLRDAIVSMYGSEDIDDIDFRDAATKSLHNLQYLILSRSKSDYRQGLYGFILMCGGFGLKLIAFILFLLSFGGTP